MNQTLRLNGTVADVDSSTRINLSYKSPIFGDLQKLSANTTLTIKLPLTATNRALIGNVDVTGVESEFAYNYFRVDYQCDGLLVIGNGIGYLLSIADQIEISVIFGGVSNFSSIKNAKLNEMPIPVEQGQIQWAGSKFAEVTTGADIMFLPLAYGRDIPVTTEFAHPVVRVPKIIEWINQAYGMNIAPIGQGLVVPCITKNSRGGYRKPLTSSALLKESEESNLGQTNLYPDLFSNRTINGSFVLNDAHTVNGDATYNDQVTFAVEMVGVLADSSGDQSKLIEIQPFEIAVVVDGTQEWHPREAEPLEVTIPKGRPFHFVCRVPLAKYYFEQYVGVNIKLSIVEKEPLTRGEKFDTIFNLPAMKVVDFIKAIMQIEGRFPQLNSAGVGWVSVDDLYANIAHAIDWSDKLNEVKSHNFQVESYAQQNMFTWAEDDTVELVDTAALYVDNKTLDTQKDIVKVPLAASDEIDAVFESPADSSIFYAGDLALVPIYYKEVDNDGVVTIEYKEVKPRIVAEVTDVRGLCGRFPPRLHLSGSAGIVERCYSKYQEVIRRPRIMKCEMLLTTQDIAQLDMMLPVYVEQLNGYFAVLSVVTKESISDVELLKL